MAETLDRTESIFAAAVALPVVAAREAYLEQACGDDPGLRGRIEALLRAHDRAGHLLDRPIPGGQGQTKAYIPSEQPGAVIAGRYKLLEAIGEGGMGTVWVAEQTEPVRRKVALKLIKAGMDSKSVLARFEAERQALAVMDHPNIAKVLDGGLTEAGRPFFVMEYVKGVPITEYCDATRLSVPERLNLFVQVCQAVQHAHQKGIIHRDLKPSNILVAPYDDQPIPKVIDFGLAKAMHQSLTERTLHTAHETVLGTPLYMSPEQAQLNNIDVDTRSDIYSLGVLLYELLTGTTPLEKQRFKEAAWDEVKRIIREEEPPRPSMRLSTTNTLPSLAAGRQIEPTRLTKLVRGELDWIVMKSLEKDRSRRYETASGFAADLQRYLAGEPVLAAPPSTRYRLWKFARKHRAALSTAAAIALLLVACAAVSTWQAVRAMRAEATAREAEHEALAAQRAEAERAEGERLAKRDALTAAAAEREARTQAQRRLAQIEKGNEIITAIFTDLNIRRVKEGTEPLEAVLAKRLVKAAEQLEGEAVGDPLTVASLQEKLGLSLLSLGHAPEAIPLFVKAGDTRAARQGAEHLATLRCRTNLATCYQRAGKLEIALPLFEETLTQTKAKLGTDHPETLTSRGSLALCYIAARKPDLALPLLEETLTLAKAKLGHEHATTLSSMVNLAAGYRAVGKLDLAIPLLMETVKVMKAKLGADHLDTLVAMNNLALDYLALGKLELALPLLEETLTRRKAKLGADHPDTLVSMGSLAEGYWVAGKQDLALPLAQEAAVGIEKRRFQLEHAGGIVGNLSGYLEKLKQFDQAETWRRKWLAVIKERRGDSPPYSVELAMLGLNLLQQKKWTEAEPVLRECLAIREKQEPDDWRTFSTQSMLGGALLGQKKYADAEPLLLAGYEGMKQRKKTIPPQGQARLPEALDRLIDLYTATDKPDEVKKWQAEWAKYPQPESDSPEK